MMFHLISYISSNFCCCYLLRNLVCVEYYIIGCRFIVYCIVFFIPHFLPKKILFVDIVMPERNTEGINMRQNMYLGQYIVFLIF